MKILEKENIKSKIVVLILAILMHFIIAAFFIGFMNHDFIEYIFFAFIWVLPLIIVGFLKHLRLIERQAILSLSAIANSIICIIVISYINRYMNINYSLNNITFIIYIFVYVYSPSTILFISSIMKKIGNKQKCLYVLSYFPIVFVFISILVAIIYKILKIGRVPVQWEILNIIFAFVLLYIYLKRNGKLKIKAFQQEVCFDLHKQADNYINFLNSLYNKSVFLLIFFLLASTIVIVITTAYAAIISGNMVRLSTINQPKCVIEYLFNGKVKETEGSLIAKKDNMYYISNKEHKLEIIKTNEINVVEIASIKEIVEYNDSVKWLDKTTPIDYILYQLDDDSALEIIVLKDGNLAIIDRNGVNNRLVLNLNSVQGVSYEDNIISISRKIKAGDTEVVKERYKLDSNKMQIVKY